MGKIFVSCCQFTDAEKIVGKEIVRIVKAVTGIDSSQRRFKISTASIRTSLVSCVNVWASSSLSIPEARSLDLMAQLTLVPRCGLNKRLRSQHTSSHGYPKGFLPAEIKTDDPRFSCYRFDELYKSALAPHATEELIVLPCCITCARADTGEDQLFCRNYPGVRDSSEAVDRWPRIRDREDNSQFDGRGR